MGLREAPFLYKPEVDRYEARTVTTLFLRCFTLAVGLLLAVPAFAQTQADAVLANLPGLDFMKLPPAARDQLAQVFQDEFDYCGRPLTLAASLKKDPCKHTRRMAVYAASMAADGNAANEIILALGKYNQSFSNKRITFKPDERQCRGSKDAKVTLVEYSDFECPYCNAARPMLEKAAEKPGVRLCWQPFPLSGHAHAVQAATAALFARDNNKFWAVHDGLFDNQMDITDNLIRELVKKVGLDEKAFAKALASGKYADELTASKDLGKVAGVDSTPSLYLNGRKLNLPISADSLGLAIDDEVEWMTNNNSWTGQGR